jgi:hypothetical protein
VLTDKIEDKAVTKAKLADDVQTSLGKADTALQSHQDISGKKDKQTVVADHNLSGATVVKGIAQNANGEIDVSTRDLTPADIGAATAAQGGKADTALQAITAGDGLKVSAKSDNTQQIDFDDAVTFIFDCGDAAGNPLNKTE